MLKKCICHITNSKSIVRKLLYQFFITFELGSVRPEVRGTTEPDCRSLFNIQAIVPVSPHGTHHYLAADGRAGTDRNVNKCGHRLSTNLSVLCGQGSSPMPWAPYDELLSSTGELPPARWVIYLQTTYVEHTYWNADKCRRSWE